MQGKINKENYIQSKLILTLTGFCLLSVVASATGTYAWFEYKSRGEVTFGGTAIGIPDQLELGFVVPREVSDEHLALYNVRKDATYEGEGFRYWLNDHDSTIPERFANLYDDYTYGYYSPVTTGVYNQGDQFELKPAPYLLSNNNLKENVPKHHYFYMKACIRSAQTTSIDKGVRIANISVTDNSPDKDGVAFRMNFKTNTGNFLCAPAINEGGYMHVGGPLDLDGDGYMDYDPITKKEFAYGEFENIVYKSQESSDTQPVRVNDRNAFTANHKIGTMAIDMEKSTPKKSYYLGREDMINNDNFLILPGGAGVVETIEITSFYEGWSEHTVKEGKFGDLQLSIELETFDI